MHNTSTEYKQMHNKTISWNENWILIFICFVGRLLLWAFNFIIFFIHNSIISYPNAKMDKRFFKSLDLRIPHRLRDLLWMVRAWYSFSPTFSSRASSSCVFSSHSLLKVITSFWHTFLAWMNPMILRGNSRWLSPLLHSSLLLLPLQVVLWFERPL